MTIEIQNINKSFGKKRVLDGLSFSVKSGQMVGILGENGSGKSTLFSVLTGLSSGDGAFMCDGADLMKDGKKRSHTVGFVPQNPPLMNELTAKDNLRLWYTKQEMERSLESGTLKMLGVDAFLKVPVHKMSGGMKKRLAIGCAIAHNPRVLLLDEPSGALDLVCKEQIYEYLGEFARSGGIVVLATHDVYELARCDKVYVLKNGKLELYPGNADPKSLVSVLKNA